MDKSIPLTQAKFDEFTRRLRKLETDGRTEVAEAIKLAKEFGDLSENAEYTSAKEEQEKLEIEIATISNILSNAYPIDTSLLKTSSVGIGNIVTIHDALYNEDLTYQLVSSYEANSAQNKISDQSPIGKALLGHKKNDIVKVLLPSGDSNEFKILRISK
ncbi:MAG: transcription elongation factor GreA [Christensenellaceae bacterium]|nr:transcription elongation factor GreA [Christensenellaceae bacterium]